MRRLFLVLALALLAAAALSASALAKEGGVELSSTPFGIDPGDPWSGTLTVFSENGLSGKTSPSISIRNLGTGETKTFNTKPAKIPTTAHSSSYVFQVVFPTAGRYRYTARDGVTDREYNFPIVQIGDPSAAPVVKPGAGIDENGFPVWPLLGGLSGAVLLALAAFVAIRNRKFAH